MLVGCVREKYWKRKKYCDFFFSATIVQAKTKTENQKKNNNPKTNKKATTKTKQKISKLENQNYYKQEYQEKSKFSDL